MLAIAYLFFFILYLWISVKLARWAAGWGKEWGYSGRKWGVAVFLLMLGLIFWDWLPMEILYRYQCENHAGFFQDKTLDEWKAENPGVWETLSMHALPEEYFVKQKHGQERSKRRFYQLPDGTELIAHYNLAGEHDSTRMLRDDGKNRYWLNQRFYWETVWTKHLFHVREVEDRIVDIKNGNAIARYVDFRTNISPLGIGTSDLSDYKFWMYKKSCGTKRHSRKYFSEFMHLIKYKEEIKL
ncbi:MAG: hypothetical protein B6D72_12975 [gamma proteobacterium symbiont of Ctena orbiculata]|nr:hypothetical protein [Candidatus Thiodiazotropha taylori]MBT3027620.1 hypothetical protein [Candidatus Thiodiazotropha taylori]MBT3035232.1 hypothetical protein [Candidatus Thiodiazotropha taylori]MBV2107467.1 hypothetical protein [Candidatus Thiodiazotropha taylori]PVV10316.1 MAG: hypothetical protein B6D72_12975 [gamma proteobacterium symbiont of Ctena orbiculata]